MTPVKRPTDAMDRSAFATELEALVARARDEETVIDGAYNVRSPRRNVPDYTIEISETTKRRPGEAGSHD